MLTFKRWPAAVLGGALLMAALVAIAGCDWITEITDGADDGSDERNLVLATDITTTVPIGNEILFVVYQGTNAANHLERREGVFAIGSNGTRVERLTDVAGHSPSFLADGRVIYWRTEGTPGLAVIEGGQATNLVINPAPSKARAVGLRGAASHQIAYVSDGHLYVVDATGGDAALIAETADLPAALEDGRVAYLGPDGDVWAIAADGTEAVRVLTPRGTVRALCGMPDGKLLLATYDADKELSYVYTANAEDGARASAVYGSFGLMSPLFDSELTGCQVLSTGYVAFSYGLPGGSTRGLAFCQLSANMLANAIGLNKTSADDFEGLWVLDGYGAL